MPSGGASAAAISARWATPRSRVAASTVSSAAVSTSGRAIQAAKTNGRPVHSNHFWPRSQVSTASDPFDRIARSPIKSTASARESSRPQPIGSGSQSGRCAGQFVEQDLGQRGAGAGAFVEGQRSHVARRHAEEQLHAQHRPAAGDAGVGDQHVAGPPQPFDRRHQRHVEPAGGERVGQPAGQIEQQPAVGSGRDESVHERLAIEVVDGADSHGSSRWGSWVGGRGSGSSIK